jgi:hypothetical protein
VSDKNTSNISCGSGLPTLLGVAFIVLKLTGIIDWSWLWVLSPFWIAAAFWVFILIVVVTIAAIVSGKK